MVARAPQDRDAFNEHILIDPILVSDIIDNLKSKLAILSVNVDNTALSFISVIIDIDDKNKIITIDKLKSDQNTNQNLGKFSLTIKSKLDGVTVTFDSQFLKYKNIDQTTQKISYPKLVEYKQRRQSYRVSIAREKSPLAAMQINEQWVNVGRICDLSEDGLCIIDENGLSREFKNQIETYQIKITFQTEEEIYCQITAANIISDKNRQLRIGAMFSSLREPEKSKILKAIMNYERDNIKKGIAQ